MKKRTQILVALLSLMMFLVCLPGVGAAATLTPPPPTEGKVSSNLHSSIVVNIHTDTSTQGVSLIKQWVCGIADNSNGIVTITGETTTYGTVEYLDAKIYLQRWNGSSWVDVTSRTYSASSNFYTRGSSNISVTSGSYYRTRGIHNAHNAGNYDAQSSVSDAILVQ
ncbi:MAG: hypothetical protein CVU90_14030 [Firmicutes bacterium HGW-Firmicutes-15]|nr:MAG: hypothetical protein CVU90_14030 [Firmicutes bacterium HGW-Firmicutes-15]